MLLFMPDDQPNIFSRAASSIADFFVRWWREATGPIKRSQHRNLFEAFLRRFLLWVPVVVLVIALFGGTGLYFFTGWRAHDLARAAMENARAGKIQLAWVQIMSAKSLRGGSPEVRRAMVYVRSAANDPSASALWDELAAESALTAEEMRERSRVAVRSASDDQFAAAVTALEQSGDAAQAAMFRSQRALRRGSIEEAIAEARTAVGESGDPENKLQLLLLLLQRYAAMPASAGSTYSDGTEEITALVDELQGTGQGNAAIAVALGAFPLPPENARAWAEAAMTKLSADNPALLPAAAYLVRTRAASTPDLHAKLSPVFAGAEPVRQADFAAFLTKNGRAEDALSLITPSKGAANAAAFEERGRALAALGRWEDLAAFSNSTTKATESVRLFFRAWAAAELGDEARANKVTGDALRAAAREDRMPKLLEALDSIGRGKAADPVIIELCGKAETAGPMFRVARDRFGRRGQFASLAAAYEAADEADSGAASVQDYRARVDLLENRNVPSSETAAAVAAAPLDIPTRFTHALALLREGRAADALGVFHDIDVTVENLPPGDKAIVIKIWEANGMNRHAAYLRSKLDTSLLDKSEYALLLSR